MRNESLAAAITGGSKELSAFVKDAEDLGLADGFATDNYKIRNRADNADFEGPILYVVAKRASEEHGQTNPLITVIDTKVVASKVKELTKNDYSDHCTVKTYGPAPGETIMAAMMTAGVVQTEAKVALNFSDRQQRHHC